MSAKLIQEAAAAIQLATKGRSAGDTAAMNVGDDGINSAPRAHLTGGRNV